MWFFGAELFTSCKVYFRFHFEQVLANFRFGLGSGNLVLTLIAKHDMTLNPQPLNPKPHKAFDQHARLLGIAAPEGNLCGVISG